MKSSGIGINSIYLVFVSSNSVDGKFTPDIVDQVETYTSFFNGDDICEKETSITIKYIILS